MGLSGLLTACGASSPGRLQQLSPALPVASYPATSWQASMNEPLETNKNAVYAGISEVLWQADREMPDRLRFDEQLEHTLHEEKKGELLLDASLKLDFRFEPHFEYRPFSVYFDGMPVKAFGMSANTFEQLHSHIEIQRYRDDKHFIIELRSTDRTQQILLYKTDKPYATLAEMYADLQNEMQHGRSDVTLPERQHNYFLQPIDQVAIPRINLAAEVFYPQLRGKMIPFQNKTGRLGKVRQNIAFLLNETGAKLATSNTVEQIDTGSIVINGDVSPKNFTLDSAFYVVVRKRVDGALPYLVLWVENSELLELEE